MLAKRGESLTRPFLKYLVDISVYNIGVLVCKLIFLITNSLALGRIEDEVAYGCYKSVNSKRNHREKEIRKSSRGISRGLQIGMIDNKASDPPKEKCKKKANKIFVVHFF